MMSQDVDHIKTINNLAHERSGERKHTQTHGLRIITMNKNINQTNTSKKTAHTQSREREYTQTCGFADSGL